MMNRLNVIMSVYNSEKYIKLAIDSILKQSYTDFKFIIIDDCSSDNSFKIIKSYKDKRIRLFQNKHRLNVAKSLNIGLKHTDSEFIARMDADDISKPNRFKIQLDYLLNHPNMGMVATNTEYIDELGKSIKVDQRLTKNTNLLKEILKRNLIIHPTVMFRSILIKQYGGYDEALNGAEDYDLWLRWIKITGIINLPQKLLYYRLHQEKVSAYAHKRVEKATVKAQIKALIRYKCNLIIIFYIIRNAISYVLPENLKDKIYEFTRKN